MPVYSVRTLYICKRTYVAIFCFCKDFPRDIKKCRLPYFHFSRYAIGLMSCHKEERGDSGHK